MNLHGFVENDGVNRWDKLGLLGPSKCECLDFYLQASLRNHGGDITGGQFWYFGGRNYNLPEDGEKITTNETHEGSIWDTTKGIPWTIRAQWIRGSACADHRRKCKTYDRRQENLDLVQVSYKVEGGAKQPTIISFAPDGMTSTYYDELGKAVNVPNQAPLNIAHLADKTKILIRIHFGGNQCKEMTWIIKRIGWSTDQRPRRVRITPGP